MDINKIFLSSTIAQSIEDIVNSNTTSTQSKIQTLDNKLNNYSQLLSDYQSRYQAGLAEFQQGDPLFNFADWEIEAPKLRNKINQYKDAIQYTTDQISKLQRNITNQTTSDKRVDDILSAAPLAMTGMQQIKKFYDRHHSSRGTTSDDRGLINRAYKRVKARLHRGTSNDVADDSSTKSKLSTSDRSLAEDTNAAEDSADAAEDAADVGVDAAADTADAVADTSSIWDVILDVIMDIFSFF